MTESKPRHESEGSPESASNSENKADGSNGKHVG